MEPGIRYETMPIPLIVEHTEFVPAGAVTFAIEYRVLTDEILDEAYRDDEAGAAIMDAARPAALDDRGVSVHVFDTATDVEFLRFDCFDDDPHYHYITEAEGFQRFVHFDGWAHGDMFPWAIDRLHARLPEMLAAAGAVDTATQVDAPLVEAALDQLISLAETIPSRLQLQA